MQNFSTRPEITEATESVSLSYRCWDCKADIGEPCSTPSGRPTKPHKVRIERVVEDTSRVVKETVREEELSQVQKAEVDTKISEAYEKFYNANLKFNERVKHLAKRSGITRRWYEYASVNGVEELLQRDGENRRPIHPTDVEALRNYARESVETREAFKAEELNYKGWSRFFLVPDGHIHSSMHCSSCNKNNSLTKFSWLPELSGHNEEDAVKEYGPNLCTVCFPSAPVAWTIGDKREDDVCLGSGTYDWEGGEPSRAGYAVGNGGTCSHCGEWASVASSSSYLIRKHKVK